MPYKNIPTERLIQVLGPMRVKYKDIFDLQQFYKDLREWLLEHNWWDVGDNSEHWESYYGERDMDSSGKLKEIWFRWRPWKINEETDASTAKVKYYLDFNFHCIAISKTEIIRDGKKLSVHKGEIEVYLMPSIEKAYMIGFSQNRLLRQFQELFTKRIYRDILEDHKKTLYQEAYMCQHFIKQWFKLKRHLPYEEQKLFFESRAWPSHIKEQKG